MTTGLYEQFLDQLRKNYEHPHKGSSGNPARPSSPGSLFGAGASASASIPPDTYIVNPQINQRRPDPSEEASLKTSSKNKLHVQKQHHHQFGEASVLGLDDLRTPDPTNSNSSALTSTISVLTRPSSTTTASLKLIAESRANLMRSQKNNLPSVFDPNLVRVEAKSETEELDLELDPFVQAIMTKMKKNPRNIRRSFTSNISSLHTDDSSAHSREIFLDAAKKKLLLEKIQPPPLHVMAESLATVEGYVQVCIYGAIQMMYVCMYVRINFKCITYVYVCMYVCMY